MDGVGVGGPPSGLGDGGGGRWAERCHCDHVPTLELPQPLASGLWGLAPGIWPPGGRGGRGGQRGRVEGAEGGRGRRRRRSAGSASVGHMYGGPLLCPSRVPLRPGEGVLRLTSTGEAESGCTLEGAPLGRPSRSQHRRATTLRFNPPLGPVPTALTAPFHPR